MKKREKKRTKVSRLENEIIVFPFAANETMTKRDSGEKGIN